MAQGVLKLTALSLVVGTACDPFPRDPQSTLDEVRGDTLLVGVVEAPPWVERRGDEATGIEAEWARRVAGELGAEVVWIWGSPAAPTWRLERLGLIPSSEDLLTEQHVVLVPPGENRWITWLEDRLRADSARMLGPLRRRPGR